MTLTKSDVIDTVYNNTDLNRSQATDAFESLLETIKRTLESGEDVLISRFGKFCVKEKNERRGRNPQTGNNMTLGARRVVTFICSGVLRGKMNGKG